MWPFYQAINLIFNYSRPFYIVVNKRDKRCINNVPNRYRNVFNFQSKYDGISNISEFYSSVSNISTFVDFN